MFQKLFELPCEWVTKLLIYTRHIIIKIPYCNAVSVSQIKHIFSSCLNLVNQFSLNINNYTIQLKEVNKSFRTLDQWQRNSDLETESEFLELGKCPPRLNKDDCEKCRMKQADNLETGIGANACGRFMN